MEQEEDGAVGALLIEFGKFLPYPLYGFEGVAVVPGTLKEELTTVEGNEVETADFVVESGKQALRAETAIIGIFIEGILLGQFANVVLHDKVVVAGSIVGLRQVVEVCHLVVVVTRDIYDGLLLAFGLEGRAQSVVHEVADALPVGLGDGDITGVVTAEDNEVDILIHTHLVDGVEDGASKLDIVEIGTADESQLIVQVGETADGHHGLVIGSNLRLHGRTCKEQDGEKQEMVDLLHSETDVI